MYFCYYQSRPFAAVDFENPTWLIAALVIVLFYGLFDVVVWEVIRSIRRKRKSKRWTSDSDGKDKDVSSKPDSDLRDGDG